MKVCEKCGKGRVKGNSVSPSNKKSRRTFSPNLHTIKMTDPETGETKKKKLCTKCLKSFYKEAKV